MDHQPYLKLGESLSPTLMDFLGLQPEQLRSIESAAFRKEIDPTLESIVVEPRMTIDMQMQDEPSVNFSLGSPIIPILEADAVASLEMEVHTEQSAFFKLETPQVPSREDYQMRLALTFPEPLDEEFLTCVKFEHSGNYEITMTEHQEIESADGQSAHFSEQLPVSPCSTEEVLQRRTSESQEASSTLSASNLTVATNFVSCEKRTGSGTPGCKKLKVAASGKENEQQSEEINSQYRRFYEQNTTTASKRRRRALRQMPMIFLLEKVNFLEKEHLALTDAIQQGKQENMLLRQEIQFEKTHGSHP